MEESRLPLVLIAVALCLASCTATEPDRALNVLVLYTDDQRFDTIHALGNEEIRTPNLDRLAAEGVAFTMAHTMGGFHGALCVPSRAMLMTGRQLFSLQGAGGVIPPDHVMMPEQLAEAGYVTFGTGKWHNDKESYARAFQQGGRIYFGGMHFPEDGGHEKPRLHDFSEDRAYPEDDRRQIEGFSSRLFADAAIDFLTRQKDSAQPFFAHVAFSSPHDPRTPPAPFADWYSDRDVTLTPSFLPKHPFDNGELDVRDERLLPWPRTEQAVRQELAAYYGMISEVDAQIGRILEALEENGHLERTLIVFAGDNGLAVGNHGLLGKQSLYDHSMRVPLILSGPGIPKGARREALTYLSDIFPTVADLLGVATPESVQGRSLVPAFDDPKWEPREAVFLAYRDVQRAVRTSDEWKLIEYNVDGTRSTQLFHLAQDPHEVTNLATDAAYSDRLAEMRRLLIDQSRVYSDRLDLSKPDWPERRSVR